MSNLKSLLKVWTEFNLPSLQKSLDATANEIAVRQDDSECSKRNLIELMKEWKKNTDEDVRNKVAPVMKAFQNEVDALNKRSKSAEGSLLSVYKILLEVPDPVPILKQAEAAKKQLEKVKDLELENLELRKTLEDYHAEFSEVKNQEITLGRLRERIKELEEETDSSFKEKLRLKEKELEDGFKSKESEFQRERMRLIDSNCELEARVKVMLDALKSAEAEMLDLKAKHEEASASQLAEIEILESELERASQNLQSNVKGTDILGDQVQSVHFKVDDEIVQSLEDRLHMKQQELAKFIEEVHNLQVSLSAVRADAEKEIALLQHTVAKKNEEIATLSRHLVAVSDYNEIKRELGILRMIEFSGSDDSELQPSSVNTLEHMLVTKNRSLQSECSALKVKNSDLLLKVGELQKTCSDAYYTIKEQKELITQLESDLLCVKGLYRTEGEGQAAPAGDAELVNKAVQEAWEDEEESLGIGKDKGLLPIISSQRERLRARNIELEAQIRSQQRHISSLESDVDSVRQDNVALYGKIKFLQSHPTAQTGSKVDLNDDSMKRYVAQYEEKMDPFSLFSKTERQRKYASLSAPEKVTLSMGRFILSNKVARTLVFFYTIILHCLVFVVLYKFAYMEQCGIDVANSLTQQAIYRNIDSATALSQAPVGVRQ